MKKGTANKVAKMLAAEAFVVANPAIVLPMAAYCISENKTPRQFGDLVFVGLESLFTQTLKYGSKEES